MLQFREKVALHELTQGLVDDLLARLHLPGDFSLQDFLTALANDLHAELKTYSTQMPPEIGGLGLSAADGRIIILVNRRRSLLAEDFTILHELGHLALGHLARDHAINPADELQADLFAEMVLKRMVNKERGPSSTLARLKRFFGI